MDTIRLIASILLALLIAMAISSRAWIADTWGGFSRWERTMLAVGGIVLATAILTHIFAPFIWRIFT